MLRLSPGQGHRDPGSLQRPVLMVWLTLCARWTAGQGSGADVTTAAVGHTATLSAAGLRDVLVFSWYRGTAVDDTQRIFSYTVSSAIEYSGPQYTGLEVGRPDGSLQIRELLTNYTGYYTVIATHTDGRIVRATRQLRVYDAIGAVGETVTLLAPVSLNLLTFSWYRGPTVTPRELIFSYIESTSTQNNGPQYTGAERGLADGSLQISDLFINHTGEYTTTTILQDGSLTTGTRQLRVYEVVSSPTVRVSTQYPLEDVDSAVLTCETSIPADTILWFFDHRPLAGDVRMQLSADNRTLTLSSVCRADSGLYQCEARNPVSAGVSAPQTLTVAFGPQKAELEPSGCRIIESGAALTLTCSAESAPTAEYQWLLNKTDLNHSDSRLIVPRVSASGDGGRYTCVTRNQLTGQSVNASVSIAVLETLPPPWLPASGGLVTLGVAVGVFLCTSLIFITAFLLYRRLRNSKKAEKTSDPSVMQVPAHHYETVFEVSCAQSQTQTPSVDSPYLKLKHGDRAIYDQLSRTTLGVENEIVKVDAVIRTGDSPSEQLQRIPSDTERRVDSKTEVSPPEPEYLPR